ncbi:S46 family peptidase [Ideonella benzenivorans]|uniref:S46 family peptidase n=1 Tax=Ideonella benzenivorans TaxID=2831643 RepID=UPI001CEC5239|nr:S46 family peptidase [Ideonella benzenivorans]
MPVPRHRRSAMSLLGATLLCALPPLAASAMEGMWTLDNLPKATLAQKYGFTPDDAWVNKVMHSAARMAGGCSTSFVSAGGLVLTNHHCVDSCLGDLSRPGQDLRRSGFIAQRPEEERQCPGMELNRLEQITDVSATFAQATAGKTGQAYTEAVNATRARLESACVNGKDATVRCDVVTLYQGGARHLYRYHRYQDVRLAFAPEVAIGAFGGDPDNFDFPRYDLDMGLLRVYENGHPAATPEFFPLNPRGPEAGELVITAGNPGRTQRLLTVAQLETLRDVDLPQRLLREAEQRGLLNQYGTEGPEQDRLARKALRWIENGFKAQYGQLETLRDPEVMARKQAEEAALRQFAANQPNLKDTLGAWDDIARAARVYREIQPHLAYTEGAQGYWTDYHGWARTLVRAATERAKPSGERLPEFADAALLATERHLLAPKPVAPALEKVKLAWSLAQMRQWLGADDPLVRQVLGRKSPQALATELVDGTTLGDPKVRQALWQGGAAAIAASQDPFIRLALATDAQARALRAREENEVEAVQTRAAEQIARVRFARTGTSVYPDATFSLRLSFGEIRGFKKNGQPVAPFTEIGGTFARATGEDPFALPQSWLTAQPALNPAQRFNMVSTNDIIGGNSGSPLINRRGELVGLIFDGNLGSLGGAYWYDEADNRAVSVHAGAILETLDKVYHADRLVQELKAGAVH